MAKANFLSVCFCALFTFSTALHAQFYAPDTEYHDPVQRVFPVEAARVLGWFGNRGTNQTHQITYAVSTKPDGTTTWDFKWLDATGIAHKQAKVSYPKKLLEAGPEFYRDVFRQLGEARWDGLIPHKAEFIRERFWKGADAAGISRDACMTTAFALVPPSIVSTNQDWIPEMSGLLIHSGRLVMAERMTIDNVLIARGAAWLVISERASAQKLDPLWPPVLSLANRYQEAVALWSKNYPANPGTNSPSVQSWNIALRDPTSRAIYQFATEPQNWHAAVPLLAMDLRMNDTGKLISELLPYLGGSEKNIRELYDLAPLLGHYGTVSGGHIGNGFFAAAARLAWMELLEKHTGADENLVAKYKPLLPGAKAGAKMLDPQLADFSLAGLKESGPLLKLAHAEGVGPLTPVAVASTRDILNHGWEMAGLQLGARHMFVAYRWGIDDVGRAIFNQSVTAADGWMPFFWNGHKQNIGDYRAALERLQMVDGHMERAGFTRHPFGVGLSDKEAYDLWVKRCWLRPRELEWQARTLWSLDSKAIAPHLKTTVDASGPVAAAEVLSYLAGVNGQYLRNLPELAALKTNLLDRLPQPGVLTLRCLTDRHNTMSNAERAVELEKLYWKNPDTISPDGAFRNYMVSGELKNARRFYGESRVNTFDTVAFSNGMGLSAYLMGIVTEDQQLREWALEDSSSGSFNDMLMGIWEAAIRDDVKLMTRRTDELIERYEAEKPPTATGKVIRGFIPLLPALKDPKHAQHNEALDYFGKSGTGTILRWILIQKHKLSEADAIRFLGGRENDPLRSVLIAYLQGNDWKALDAMSEIGRQGNLNKTDAPMASMLYMRMTKQTDRKVVPSQKPKDVVSVYKTTLETLKKQGRLQQSP